MWHFNNDHTVAVSDTQHFHPMQTCPHKVKVLLLTQGGTATLGQYRGEAGFIGWFPIPQKMPEYMMYQAVPIKRVG
jgi:hypothetical protein